MMCRKVEWAYQQPVLKPMASTDTARCLSFGESPLIKNNRRNYKWYMSEPSSVHILPSNDSHISSSRHRPSTKTIA